MAFSLTGKIVHIEVLALGERRGPAREARQLYRECICDIGALAD